MNKEIASILKGRLTENGGLPFVEIIAGLAQTVEYVSQNSDGNPLTKKMPVSYDTTTAQDCSVTPEKALIPDSSKKGMIYFEDMGITFLDRIAGGGLKYRATLIMVCWMNRAKLVGDNYKEITSYCVATALKKLKIKTIGNSGNFTRIIVTPGRLLPQDKSVFSRYTYDETITQYLRPPFEFYGQELTVEFCINPDCVEQLQFKDPICY